MNSPIRTLLMGAAACALATAAAEAAPAKPAAKGHAMSAHAAKPGAIFERPSPLFLQAPEFGKIKDSDFLPAIYEGMAQQKAEVTKIANNPAAPTFDNTIVALERSGRMLERF